MTSRASPFSPWPARLRGLTSVAALVIVGVVALRPAPEPPALVRDEEFVAAAPRRPQRGAEDEFVIPGSIDGFVRSPGGAAIVDAQVCAFPAGPLARFIGTSAPTCARSDAGGYYVLERLLPGRHDLHASAARHLPAPWVGPDGRSELVLRASARRSDVDFELGPGGAEISGVVEDASGGVVEDVWVRNDHGEGPPRQGVARVAARSDASGRFSLWVAPGSLALSAAADGYAPASASSQAPARDVRLVLTPGAVIVGRVLAAGGEPIADAEVEVVDVEAEDLVFRRATTDASGAFRIEGLLPGRYRPTARAEAWYGEADHTFAVGLGETTEPMTISVRPARTLAGQVVFIGDGAPCPSGQVFASGERIGASGPLDADGRVRVLGLPPGAYSVGVECDSGTTVGSGSPPIIIGDGEVAPQVWQVLRGYTVRGEVVDTRGRPVAGVGVSLATRMEAPERESSDDAAAYGFNATSDPSGRFLFEGVVAGSYAAQVGSQGSDVEESRVRVAADVTGLRLVAAPRGGVRGVVVDEKGQPVADAGVTVGDEYGATGPDGRFEVLRVRPGEQEAFAERPMVSIPADELRRVNVRVVADEFTEVRLVVAGDQGEISGKVVDAAGAALSDAYVAYTFEASQDAPGPGDGYHSFVREAGMGEHLVDADGKFTFSGLPRGPFTVRAFHRGGNEVFAEHVERGSEVVLTLLPAATIAGRVRGTSSPELTLHLLDEHRSGRVEVFMGDRWRFEGVVPGKYDLWVVASDGAGKRTIEVDAGEQLVDLEIDLVRHGEVRGRVIDADTGAPLAGAVIRPHGETLESHNWIPQASHSAADGSFRLTGLPPGELEISIESRGSDGVRGRIAVPATISSGASFDLATVTLQRAVPVSPSIKPPRGE